MVRSGSYGAGLERAGGAFRFLVMAAALTSLLVAMAAGLARAGMGIPLLPEEAPLRHGPLMVSGFLGTLIAAERAAGLGRPWAWVAPVASAVGAALLLAGIAAQAAFAAFAFAGFGLVAVFLEVLHLRPGPSAGALLAGAGAWLASSLHGLAGGATVELVPWWVAFLVLTIAGERLELGRFRATGLRAVAFFLPAAALVLLGAAIAVADRPAGIRVEGVGLLLLGGWLLRYDVALRTVWGEGQARYVATCLLSGFVWLALAGALFVAGASSFAAGPRYDAMLHALFLGFVVAMVFGHAPIVLPGVLGLRVPYRPRFYLQLALLHAGLGLRLAGDLAGADALRQAGTAANVAAVLLFVALTATTVLAGRRERPFGGATVPAPPVRGRGRRPRGVRRRPSSRPPGVERPA